MTPSIYQSFLYAHFIGLFLVILSLVILFRLQFYVNVFKTAQLTAFSMFTWGVVLILVGMILVNFHNVWLLKPRLVVTLLVWSILIKGIFLVVFPVKTQELFYRWISSSYLKVTFITYLILGLVLVLDSVRLVLQVTKTQNIYAHLFSGFQHIIA